MSRTYTIYVSGVCVGAITAFATFMMRILIINDTTYLVAGFITVYAIIKIGKSLGEKEQENDKE